MRRDDLASVRAGILSALGLTAGVVAAGTGCGSEVVVEPDGSGGAGASGPTSAASTTKSGLMTTTAATTGGFTSSAATTGSGMNECGPYTSEPVDVPTEGVCAGYYNAQYVCYPALGPGEICEDKYKPNCILDTYSCGLQEVASTFCWAGEGCCYYVVGDCPVGRPFIVEGAARLASSTATRSWLSNDESVIPSLDGIDAATRTALADFWEREGLGEHASVASFSRFVLQLLALGAPADLVRDASRAVSDEVEHARIAFSFASAYAGRPVGPSALDVGGALSGVLDRASVAASIASEGCIAETVSATLIRQAANEATDPAVRAALSGIADEEMEHAVLAWRTVAWLLETGDGVIAAAVAEVFERCGEHVGLGPLTETDGEPPAMRAHGYLPVAERRSHAAQVLATVVAPCAQALLASMPEEGRLSVGRPHLSA